MLSTATPPHRVLFISDPALSDYVPDNTNTIVFLNLSTRPRAHLPHTSDAPRRTTTGGRGAATDTSGNSSRPRLSTSPTSPKLTNSDTRDAYHHQPRDHRMDDDPAVRDIAASPSPGGGTTGNASDPGLRDPTETPHCTAGHGSHYPRVPGTRYLFSPTPMRPLPF